MDLFRYINNTPEDIEEEGFIVRSYSDLQSSVEIPALTKMVDFVNLDGYKNGQPINYVTPTEAIPTPSLDIESHISETADK